EALARFRTEAEAVARLQHPNIVQIYEVGEHEQRPYFSLEFVAGGSLDKQLAGQPLATGEAARLAATLARAMHNCHQPGMVHRDLKPANILLSGVRGQESGVRSQESGVGSNSGGALLTPDPCPLTPVPKVTDFGLAKYVEADVGQTRTGAVLGTPCYM